MRNLPKFIVVCALLTLVFIGSASAVGALADYTLEPWEVVEQTGIVDLRCSNFAGIKFVCTRRTNPYSRPSIVVEPRRIVILGKGQGLRSPNPLCSVPR